MATSDELLDDVASVFSIFHDGGLESRTTEGEIPTVFVRIGYLAERIDPKFAGFEVDLLELASVRFQPWPDGDNSYPPVVGLEAVLALDLEILSGKDQDDSVTVLCLSHSGDYPSQGGELSLTLAGVAVRDESGTSYSLAELEAVCSGYWNEWSAKHQAP